MPRSGRRAACLAFLLVAAVAAGCASARPARGVDPARRARDSAYIHDEIVRGAEAFMAGNPEGILAHYARDVVLSYPNVPDQDYATLERGYAALRDRPAGVRVRTAPTFEEVLVSGDLAIVRVRWTTTIDVADPPRTTVRRLKDLQVWRREPDGRWMFIRGMHYPDTVAVAAR